jgi:hypothetical protein
LERECGTYLLEEIAKEVVCLRVARTWSSMQSRTSSERKPHPSVEVPGSHEYLRFMRGGILGQPV